MLAAALAVLACAPSRPPLPPPPAAFYWEATGPEGGALSLLGSVHLVDARELALDPRVEAAFAGAAELVLEVDVRGLSDLDALELTRYHGLLPPERALRDVLSPETHARLVAHLRAHHYPLDVAGRMRPWLLAQLVAELAFESAGYDAANGVDAWFLRRAEREARPVSHLETLDEQLALFAALPDALQETLLREMLRESDGFAESTHAILRAWERGDEAALLALLLGTDGDPELRAFHEQLFIARNHLLCERLAALAADGRARFAVLGTGHLIGPESVPVLLAARGFDVRRIPDAFVRVVPLSARGAAP